MYKIYICALKSRRMGCFMETVGFDDVYDDGQQCFTYTVAIRTKLRKRYFTAPGRAYTCTDIICTDAAGLYLELPLPHANFIKAAFSCPLDVGSNVF